MGSLFLPKCPVCGRPLTGHGVTDFLADKLIICKQCGARLTARVSWLCAYWLLVITVLWVMAWIIFDQPHAILFSFLIWCLSAPFIQVRYTILESKHARRKKSDLTGELPEENA